MPNTLAHIAVQGAANASWQPGRYVPWVLLGCVLPDVPWIANRVLRFAAPDIDPVALELYFYVQASWLFSSLLGVAFAAFARRPFVVGVLLAGNSLLHLLLDAVEIKPGSGVHLLAPFSWRSTSFSWVWPEHPLVTAATLLGAIVAPWFLLAPRFRSAGERLVFSRRRVAVAMVAVAAYLVLPQPLREGPWEADYRSIRSLTMPEVSIRNRIELERDEIVVRDSEMFVEPFGREFRLIAGQEIADGAIVSVFGYLSAPDTIRATEVHVNAALARDVASIAGLLAIAAVWVRLLALSLPGRMRRPERGGSG